MKYRARAGERFFHYIFIIANLVGLIAYYAMASDLAWRVVRESNQVSHSGLFRQIFWAKYVFWVVEFPAVILALGILSGVSWATIVFHIVLSWVWIISFLVGAFTATNYKWGFFAFGIMAQIALGVSMLYRGMRSSDRVGSKSHYLGLAGWTNFLWLLYSLAWALSDGGNRIGVTASFIWWGILDIMLLTVVGFAVVVLSSKWDYNRLNIAFTQYGRVPATTGTFPEKEAVATPAGGNVGGPVGGPVGGNVGAPVGAPVGSSAV